MFRIEALNKTVLLPYPRIEETLTLPAVLKRSMNNTPISYRSGKSKRIVHFTFGNINRNVVLEVIDLLKTTKTARFVGEETVYGTILNTPEFSHVGRSNNTFTLDVECQD